LRNNQAGLNRLSQADLVCEDAPPFPKASKGKNNCINLVRVGIDTRLALRRRISRALVWTANPNEILGKNPLVEGVHGR
jgi:hypothetical protein